MVRVEANVSSASFVGTQHGPHTQREADKCRVFRPLSQHHPRIVSFPRPGSGSRLPSSSPPRLSVPGKGPSAVHILQTCAQCSKNLQKEKTQDCCPPQELELKTAFRSPINLENRLS